MGREIKFRGQPIGKGGVWMVGIGAYKSQTAEHLVLNAKGDYVEVVHLCQYTGLKDKNGKEIFEGDILTGQNCRFVVKYDERQAAFVAVNSTLPKGFGLPMSQTWIDETNKIICGNIHNNPELMKLKK